jgi:hypothetical protein
VKTPDSRFSASVATVSKGPARQASRNAWWISAGSRRATTVNRAVAAAAAWSYQRPSFGVGSSSFPAPGRSVSSSSGAAFGGSSSIRPPRPESDLMMGAGVDRCCVA